MGGWARRIGMGAMVLVLSADLLLAGYWWGSSARSPAQAPATPGKADEIPTSEPGRDTPGATMARGPWGRLKTETLWLAPHPDLLNPDLCPLETPPWNFRGFTQGRLESFLDTLELPPASRALLRTTTRCDGNGCSVRPPPSLQEALSPAARTRLFEQVFQDPDALARWSLIRLDEEDFRSWLRLSRLSPDWQQWILGISFPFRGARAVADLPLACRRATSARERAQVVRLWALTPSKMAWLHVGPDDDASALAAWWSRYGNRRKDLLPLLESAREVPGGLDLDLVHLLPRGARTRLYSYPSPQDPPRDCLWTVLNFGVEQPDDSVLDPAVALDRLDSHYREVPEKDRQMGDAMLVWEPGEKRLVHAALWLAGDLFLTKNGRHFLNPWILDTGESLMRIYNPEGTMTIKWMRRIEDE